MSAKLATLGLLKINIYRRKDYVIIPDVTNEILSRDSNYIADVVMGTKLRNFSIFMREVNITSIF